MKLHPLVGTKTNVVAAAVVTDSYGSDSHDSRQFIPLLQAGAQRFQITEVSADKARHALRFTPQYTAIVEQGGNVPTLTTVLELIEVLGGDIAEMMREPARNAPRSAPAPPDETAG
jgi:hypothetical protein